MSKTLVAIAAHADDVELNAGGTVAKWAAEEGDVHIIMMTNNCSGLLIPEGGDEDAIHLALPAQTSATRHREQEAAAAKIGAKVHYMGFCQRHFFDGTQQVSLDFNNPAQDLPGIKGTVPLIIAAAREDCVAKLAELLIGLKPDLVLTQTIVDRDPEHHSVASMVWRVFRENPEHLKSVPLRFWTPGSSCIEGMIPVTYDHIEDVSDYYDTKVEMLKCHASQMTETRWQMVGKRTPFWGEKIGARYGEPFITAQFQWE